jgi:hypothetical protein
MFPSLGYQLSLPTRCGRDQVSDQSNRNITCNSLIYLTIGLLASIFKYGTYILSILLVITMAQLHLYVPDRLAEELKHRARAEGISVSRYLALIVHRELGKAWPDGYFREVVGGWKGEPMQRPPQGEHDSRESL